jgi:hypothetical protein
MMTATLPQTLDVGLKEWATVCGAMEAGRQILLLRKGGIYESGGEFELEHRRFLFFPTYLHQNLAMLKPEAQGGFEPRSDEPQRIELCLAGQVTDIIPVKSREQMDEIDDAHIWTAPLIDMRFNYRPENPLYLLLVRAYKLVEPVTVENTPAYAGCKSWVPLESAVSTQGARPVLDETTYQTQRQLILARLEGVSTGF